MANRIKISAFIGRNALKATGNACYVDVLSSAQEAAAPAAHNLASTYCQTHRLDSEQVSLQCFSGLYPIRCCGHGLLSAAHYWLHETQSTHLSLVTSESMVKAYTDTDLSHKVWLQFTRLHHHPITMPPWVAQLYPKQSPIKAVTYGDEQGYLLLQWPDGTDIGELTAPAEQLGLFTRRALICTARVSHHVSSIVYRYFAPQYGVNEDAATGSAMRLLVDFFQQPELQAVQLSQQRGLLFGRLVGDRVEVGGYCQTEAVDAA
ncbi:PhzF family phenazine biosynthesis protein [Sinobacterium caligoides]|nr:PhzF family phenazine biosynthesis protein [Sinobacterium caligoides]